MALAATVSAAEWYGRSRHRRAFWSRDCLFVTGNRSRITLKIPVTLAIKLKGSYERQVPDLVAWKVVCTSAAEKFNVPVRLTATMYLPPSDVTSTWAATNWKEKVLHSFCSQPNCADGDYPTAGLIFDAAGNLYGTTDAGGAYGAYGPGTVFELTPAAGGGWTEQVLHSFDNDYTDGVGPYAGLIFDAAGNLYGTTSRRRLLPAVRCWRRMWNGVRVDAHRGRGLDRDGAA